MAYSILNCASFRHLVKDVDVLEFVKYELKRCDLRFDPNKFDDIKKYRQTVGRQFVYKKLLNALKAVGKKKTVQLSQFATKTENEDAIEECIKLLNAADLTTKESDFIYKFYYLNYTISELSIEMKKTTEETREFHTKILKKLRKVNYA